MSSRALVTAVALVTACGGLVTHAQDGFRFKSGVDLVNVTATVSDDDGRFVASLTKDDFTIFENGRRQEISHFSNERTPVSLGIALDASGSMTPDKMAAARSAIDRFIYDLLGDDDELFFLEFASTARITQNWTTDRAAISRAVGRVDPVGGTALYDAVARALPVAAAGRHKKKAVLVISDGNDTSSSISVARLRQQIRDSEVLVYALGVDGTARNETPRARPPIGLPHPQPVPATPDAGADSRPAAANHRRRGQRRHLGPTGRRARQSRCPARGHRRHRRPHRNRPRLRRTAGGHRPSGRRVEQAVLAGLFEHRGEGRPLAPDPRGNARSPLHRPRPPRLHGIVVVGRGFGPACQGGREALQA